MAEEKNVRFLSPKEAARRYGLNEGTLANLRSQMCGCKFYKVNRKVLYEDAALDVWVKRHPVLTLDSIKADGEL